ncbi:MAG TPA: dephospho-CoA kinase [Bacteroidia bacterium]|nr:dephospho-CoA kinase [Bacteroidia bacterium]
MKKIGLTGGIGSGKSFVAEIFRHLGVPVFSSDDAGRDLQNSDPEVQAAMRKLLGDVFLPDGTLDRQKVAGIVFNDPEKLKQLNEIVHPAVGKAFGKFCVVHAHAKFVIKEAAIIFEAGIDKHLDGTILVTAPDAVRIQRVMKRDGISEDEVRARMARQWPDMKKLPLAKWKITNDGKAPLLKQVLKINMLIS